MQELYKKIGFIMTYDEFILTVDPESVDGNVQMCLAQFYEEYLQDYESEGN